MTAQISAFLRRCAQTVYPEVRSQLHDTLTGTMAEKFNASLKPASVILDVGCGKGPALEWFTKAGHRPIGITLSPQDVADCEAAGHDCREMDQNDLPAGWTGFFDAVWARHVLEHSPIPYYTLCEFWRVLKPGGWLYAEMPAPGTVAGHCGNPNHYSVLTPEMWGHLIGRAGFDGADKATHMTIPLPEGPDLYFAFICQKKPKP
jgi:2-polyprenyl-3-methyl-5-hydroxy-6-metoxy-1,4-benzoquinol methylase